VDLKEFLLSLITIYVSARLLGEVAARLRQSAVLGELLAGVLLGGSVLNLVQATDTLKLLGEVGLILLLFEIGLESDLQSFLKVGWSAAAVAILGVVTPFLLGYAFALALHMTQFQAVFIGVALTPTSVAIPVRVLHDLGRLATTEGNIILGAAVLDDILALVGLSVVVGMAESGAVSWLDVSRTAGLAILFLTLAILVGIRYAHLFSGLVNKMNTRGALVIAAMIFALLLSYSADAAGLAPLIGAFAAGLVLAKTEHHAHIEERIKPVADVFVPVFFVLVGVAVDLSHLNPFNSQNWPVLLLAAALTFAAVIGKLVSGMGAMSGKLNRWGIAIGMLPRGEVVMIFAVMGLSNRIITEGQYGALLIVMVVTTLITPVLLKLAFRSPPSERQEHRSG
jgi:Kef-type K+ transport system membrane component KefB